MRFFKKKNNYEELNGFILGMSADSIEAVSFIDKNLNKIDEDSPIMTAILTLMPSYALGCFLTMVTDSYEKGELGAISIASHGVFTEVIASKFASMTLNYLIHEKHLTVADAQSNAESIGGMAYLVHGRLSKLQVKPGALEKVPELFIEDAIKYVDPSFADDAYAQQILGDTAKELSLNLQRRYKDRWLTA